jgi:hypothetical protein
MQYSEAVHQFIVDFKKAYDSVLYNIKFGIPMKLVRLIKMCLTRLVESG